MKPVRLLLLSCCILLLSCGKDAEQIEATFNEMKQLAQEFQSQEITTLIDQDSKDYLMAIEELLRNKSEVKLETLGEKNNCELITRCLYQLLEQPDEVSVEKRSLEEMVLLAQLASVGILNPNNKKRLYFKEIHEVNGNKAIAVIRVRAAPTGKHYVNSKYTFTKEDDQWKINLPSTFSFDEKIMNVKWRKSGKPIKTFISDFIQSDNKREEVKMRYRRTQ